MDLLELKKLEEVMERTVTPAFGERYAVRRANPDGGITGYVVRKNWRGVAIPERQRELDDYLHNELGDEADQISLILTFSPEEYEAWAEDQGTAA